MNPVFLGALVALHRKCCEEGHPYLLGAKPPLGSDSTAWVHSDCSGYVRWLLDRCGLTLPDGSATQHEWCENQGVHSPYYRDAATEADGGRLFIAFITPNDADGGIGHVWLLCGGHTIECHGGRGVDSRPWNAAIEHGEYTLASLCAACYELAVG